MRNKHFFLVGCVAFFCFAFSACDLQDKSKMVSQAGEHFNSAILNPKWNTGIYHARSGAFFLGGEQGAIAYSEDGRSWLASSTPSISEIKALHGSDATGILVAAGANGEVLRSADAGKSWQTVKIITPQGVALEHLSFSAIAYVKHNNIWLVGGTKNAIIRSIDDAKTWQLVSYDDSDSQLEILDIFADDSSAKVFFAAQNGVYGVSADQGENWDIAAQPLEKINAYIPHLVKYIRIGTKLFIAADEGNLLISEDNGETWRVEKLPSSGYVTSITRDPQFNTLISTTQTGEIFISKDDGNSWQAVSFAVQNWPSDEIPYITKLLYDNATRSLIIVGNSGLMARSKDGGTTWYADILPELKNLSLSTLVCDSKRNLYVAAGLGGVIAVSQNLSIAALPTENWQIVRPGIDLYIRDVLHLEQTDSFIAVGQLGGVWLSEDDAQNWRSINVDYPIKNQPPHLRHIIRDKKSGALLAAGPAGSIIRSTDSGKNWSSVFRGEFSKGEAFTQILYDKEHGNYYVPEIIFGYVYKSSDIGRTWQKVAEVQKAGHRLWHGAVSQPLDLIFLVGQKGAIALGKNQGQTWLHPTTKISNDLYGAYADEDSNVLLAVGDYGKILRSENGEQWSSVESGTAQRLRRVFKDSKHNVLVAIGAGGTVLRSEDLGLSWQRAELPGYQGELRRGFADKSSTLIVVGQEGGLFTSNDSAKTWRRVETPTERHLRSATISSETGTIVAVGEALLRIDAIE